MLIFLQRVKKASGNACLGSAYPQTDTAMVWQTVPMHPMNGTAPPPIGRSQLPIQTTHYPLPRPSGRYSQLRGGLLIKVKLYFYYLRPDLGSWVKAWPCPLQYVFNNAIFYLLQCSLRMHALHTSSDTHAPETSVQFSFILSSNLVGYSAFKLKHSNTFMPRFMYRDE